MWNKPQALMWLANLLTGLALLLLFYSLVFVAINSPLFPVRSIQVNGNLQHLTREQLQYVVRHEIRGTFFTLDLDRTRSSFEKLPWVRKVEIRRQWPDQLEVHIEEHRAVARWGNIALLNTYGERFDAASNENLPVLEGPEGSEKEMVAGLRAFGQALKPTGKQANHIWLSERRAWRLQLDKQLIIEVGRDQAQERVQRFANAYQNSVGKLQQALEYVDLRYPNGFAIRLPAGMKMPAATNGAGNTPG